MDQVMKFAYQQREIRVLKDEDGDPWFVAKDVCEVLEIINHRQAVENLDEDEVSKEYLIDALGRRQEMHTISESGLYTLIIRSNKPEARAFRRWVTHEVLPSIRRNGYYTLPEPETDETRSLLFMAREYERLDRIFRAIVSMARTAGFRGQQAVARGNMIVKQVTGYDCLDLLDASYLAEPTYLSNYVLQRCRMGNDETVSTYALYEDYREWCGHEGIAPFGRNTFYRELVIQYPEIRKIYYGESRQLRFSGIDILHDNQAQKDQPR